MMTIAAILTAAMMCREGDEQVDLSRYFPPTASLLELRVTLKSANGALVVYSPGYMEQQVRLTQEQSFGRIPFAEPILCLKTTGGPFEFNIDIVPVEEPE